MYFVFDGLRILANQHIRVKHKDSFLNEQNIPTNTMENNKTQIHTYINKHTYIYNQTDNLEREKHNEHKPTRQSGTQLSHK